MKKREKFIACDLCDCKNNLNDALKNDDYDKFGEEQIIIYCVQCGSSILIKRK